MAGKKKPGKSNGLLEFLSSLIVRPGHAAPQPSQPFAPQVPAPMMEQQPQPMTPAGPLGTGLAQGAADLQRLYPMWQQAYIDGQTEMQFADWLQAQGYANPNIMQ